MLPVHWVVKFCDRKQRKYYLNTVNMVRTWKRPSIQSKGPQKTGRKQTPGKKQGKQCDASRQQAAETGKCIKTSPPVATAGQTGHDRLERAKKCFKGATVHEIGCGCAVLTFVDENMERLLPAAVEYVLQEGKLEYDKQFSMMQKMCTRRRGEGLFSDTVPGYAFSGTTVVATALPSCLRALLDYVNQFVSGDDKPFTAVFVNHYRSPEDAIYMHSDKDVAGNEEVGVVAISCGMPRKLKFRPIDGSNPDLLKLDIETAHGQALVMYGYKFQSLFKHGITAYKDKHHHKASGQGPLEQGRVSFTFRRHHSTRS